MFRHQGRGEWSLVFFTLLTQMAVGTFLVFGLILVLTPDDAPLSDIYAQSILWITLIILILGGISAFLHLGNPYRAGHAISNFRRSWLSREGISSGLFSFLVLLMLIAQFSSLDFGVVNILLFILAFLCGLVLIYSISRLYMLRTVPAWNNLSTPISFFITTFLLGILVNAAGLIYYSESKSVVIINLMIVLLVGLQLAVNTMTLLYLSSKGGAALESIRILSVNFRTFLIGRWLTALFGICFLLLGLFFWPLPIVFYIAFVLVIFSELLGRYLFFGFYRREGI